MEPKPEIIISRHDAAIQWVAQQLNGRYDREEEVVVVGDTSIPVVSHISEEDDVKGKVVLGNLPLNLAAQAEMIWSIEFDSPPRGQELSVSSMEKAGARVAAYSVSQLNMQLNMK